MIDFQNLKCELSNGASVGIGVEGTNANAFYLPIGYINEKTVSIDAEQKKQYFFDLYRLFKAYAKKNKLDEKKDLKESNPSGTFAKKDGYCLKVKETGEETLLYTKVNFLDTIMDAFDPHAIQNIANRRAYSEDFQFEDALNHLDNAIFLNNGAFMVDEALVSRKQLLIEPVELAQMFCFIYLDVKTQLNEQEEVEAQYRNLAENFIEQHLFPQASLFEQDSFEQVKDLIKQRLEIIDNNTALKDEDYWTLHNAIYTFLYGDPIKGLEDTYWGIKDFWPIWEDLCLESVSNSGLKNNVMMADTERKDLFGETTSLTGAGDVFLNKEKFTPDNYPFKLTFGDNVKHLKPDLCFTGAIETEKYVTQSNGTHKQWENGSLFRDQLINFYKFSVIPGYSHPLLSIENEVGIIKKGFVITIIIDFKYKQDISELDRKKQMMYMHFIDGFSISEFWLPGAGVENTTQIDESTPTPQKLDDFSENTRSEIKTRKINIHKLVKTYIGVAEWV